MRVVECIHTILKLTMFGHIECTHGDLHLVGGESQSEGRVEMCYNGDWYSLCRVGNDEASVLCKQLGHTAYSCKQDKYTSPSADKIVLDKCLHLHMLTAGASVFTDGRFGQKPSSQDSLDVYCYNPLTVSNWTECRVSKYCSYCHGDAIKCFGKCSCVCTLFDYLVLC